MARVNEDEESRSFTCHPHV